MGNTTFTGAVRSENGFKVVSKNATTGAITEGNTLDSSGLAVSSGASIGTSGVVIAPVALADSDVTLTAAVNGGRVNVVPDGGQDNTYTLPSPTAGLTLTFVYGGAAADGTDAIFDTGSDTNFFIGGVVHMDSDAGSGGDEIVPVFADGDSNSILQVNVPDLFRINMIADGTNWYIDGWVSSATAPAFSDQA